MVEINNTVGYLYEQTITQEELAPVVETEQPLSTGLGGITDTPRDVDPVTLSENLPTDQGTTNEVSEVVANANYPWIQGHGATDLNNEILVANNNIGTDGVIVSIDPEVEIGETDTRDTPSSDTQPEENIGFWERFKKGWADLYEYTEEDRQRSYQNIHKMREAGAGGVH
ncbi:MAG: hypothetical protein MK033_03710 [Candidatus Caenarcaniphilales bacterium]|nr:hypothetical protein [Candidatus Caenarcaniphilales bacterium]